MVQWKSDGLEMAIGDREKRLDKAGKSFEVVTQQKMGLIARLRAIEEENGSTIVRHEGDCSDCVRIDAEGSGSGVAVVGDHAASDVRWRVTYSYNKVLGNISASLYKSSKSSKSSHTFHAFGLCIPSHINPVSSYLAVYNEGFAGAESLAIVLCRNGEIAGHGSHEPRPEASLIQQSV